MKNPNFYADSFDDWQQSLLKLKTSQMSVAQNRLSKVLISTERAKSLCRVTPSPWLGVEIICVHIGAGMLPYA